MRWRSGSRRHWLSDMHWRHNPGQQPATVTRAVKHWNFLGQHWNLFPTAGVRQVQFQGSGVKLDVLCKQTIECIDSSGDAVLHWQSCTVVQVVACCTRLRKQPAGRRPQQRRGKGHSAARRQPRDGGAPRRQVRPQRL